MRLSLARWDDARGQSAGWWLIREIAGLTLVRDGRQWLLRCVDRLDFNFPTAPMQTWGSQFSARPGCELLAEHPHLRRRFSTRQQALLAVACTLEPSDSCSTISLVLGEQAKYHTGMGERR